MYSASVTASQWLRVGAIADLRWMEERVINCMGETTVYEEAVAGVDMGSRIEGKPLFSPEPIWVIEKVH